MTDKPEPHGRAAEAQESQSTLGWVAEWLGLSAPHPAQRAPERPLYGEGGAAAIRPSSVIQGDVNDCFFMAPTAAFAISNKEFITDAIRKNANGTYTVTFAGAKDKPQTVAAPTEDELKTYAQAGTSKADGIWPAVMEKAFGQYLKNNPAEREKILGHSAGWFISDPQEYADAGRASMVFKLYTGYDASGLQLSHGHSVQGARDFLSGAFSGDKQSPVVAGIGKDNQTALQMGLHPEHDYTVMGYKDGIVTLRDPRGKTENNELGRHANSTAGVFTMKVEDFARAFDEIVAARTKPMFGGGAMINRGNFRPKH